jgi:hypothetical protein
MKKLIFLVFLLTMCILTGCKSNSIDNIGLKELGIDKSKGKLNNYVDSHGSMGDGCTYIEIQFDGNNAEA